MRALSSACWLLGVLAGSPAEASDDLQAWAAANATAPLGGDLFVWLEAQVRATDDVGGGSQILLRPAAGIQVSHDAHVIAGYAYVRTDPEAGGVSHEHRAWQQVQFVPLHRRGGAPLITSRTRLEQRFLEGQAGTAWRLRQSIRGQWPLASTNASQAVVSVEGFLNLNSTSGGTRSGFDQLRTFLGVRSPFIGGVHLEAGYLNQVVHRRGPDQVNHILSTTFSIEIR